MKFGLFLVVFLLAFAYPIFAIDITECTTITESGDYVLVNNIADEGGDCIVIEANNVNFDCGGFTIDGIRGVENILISLGNGSPMENMSVSNCGLSEGSYGIYSDGVSNVWIENITTYRNWWDIEAINGNNLQFKNLYLYAGDKGGISVKNSNNINATNFSVHTGWDYNSYGFVCENCSNIIIDCYNRKIRNDASGGIGIYLWGENFHNSNANIKNCFFEYSDWYPIAFVRANNNVVENVHMGYYSFANTGIYLYQSSNNIIRNSKIEYSPTSNFGIQLKTNDDVELTNNQIYNSFISGFYGLGFVCDGSNCETMHNNHIFNNYINGSNIDVYVESMGINNFNTTKQTGLRIYTDGNEIGGNYYRHYSETCRDNDGDGFCDEKLSIGSSYDYLPYSIKFGKAEEVPQIPNVAKGILDLVVVLILAGIGLWVLKKMSEIEKSEDLIKLVIGIILVVVLAVSLLIG